MSTKKYKLIQLKVLKFQKKMSRFQTKNLENN